MQNVKANTEIKISGRTSVGFGVRGMKSISHSIAASNTRYYSVSRAK